jgi:ABC-2 type transport system ATP-binding protein
MLTLNNVSRRFNEKDALKEVDLLISKAEMVGVLGPNGSGKTSLLRILAGVDFPSFGTVLQSGLLANEINASFDYQNLVDHLSVKANIELVHSMSVRSQSRPVDNLTRFGLDEAGRKKFKNLSFGLKKRALHCLSFMNVQKLYIFDEPTDGLDEAGCKLFFDVVEEFNKNHQAAFIISSHRPEELEGICTRFVILNQGRIVADLPKFSIETEFGNLRKAYRYYTGSN